MCTLNNHQLWSRNIYDHELMIMPMVPTYQHQSNQNIFKITSTKLNSINDVWRFDRFDFKVLIRMNPEYIKSTLQLS